MDEWLDNISADDRPAAGELAKIVRDKPSELTDACYTATGESVTDEDRCRQLYPLYGNPRLAAGEPLSQDYLKCELKPVRRWEYPPLTDEQFARLRSIFREGACDYTRPPAERRALKGTWLAYPWPGHSVRLP
jgi:hypothetical protein